MGPWAALGASAEEAAVGDRPWLAFHRGPGTAPSGSDAANSAPSCRPPGSSAAPLLTVAPMHFTLETH